MGLPHANVGFKKLIHVMTYVATMKSKPNECPRASASWCMHGMACTGHGMPGNYGVCRGKARFDCGATFEWNSCRDLGVVSCVGNMNELV